ENQGLNLPLDAALDKANNHLFVRDTVVDNIVEFDATTGATIKYHFADAESTLLYDGHNHLFTVQRSVVAELDATTGATINPNFIPVSAIGLALDGNNHLFVGNGDKVGEYDATTGAAINPNFIAGLNGVWSIAFVTAVPEPSSLVLAALGFAGLAACGWRRGASSVILGSRWRVWLTGRFGRAALALLC